MPDNPVPPRRAFKDADGNEWFLKLDTFIMDDLKNEGLLDIDEFEKEPQNVLGKLVDGNRTWLPQVLCVALNEQREKKKIERIKFDGEALDRGASQLMEAIIDFFPFTKRPALRAALDQTKKAQELTVGKAKNLLEGQEVENAIKKKLDTEAAELMDHIGS